jgi:hypothetical protein
MSLTFLIIVALTVAVTFLVISTSLILVVHKNTNRHRQNVIEQLKNHYSEIVTKFLMAEIPDLDPHAPRSVQFKTYEKMLTPLKQKLERMSSRRRRRHREAIKNVLLEFSKDIFGEAADRLVYIAYSFDFVEEQIALLKNVRWWVRAHAARDLGFLGAKRAIAPLTAALEDINAEVRFQAIQALIILVGVDGLRTVFRVGRNLSTWNMMALSVIVLRFREDAVPCLLEGLEAKDQSIVLFCIEMLAEIGFVTAVEPLRSIAKEYPNIIVRTKAVEALGRLGDSRAVSLLTDNASNTFPDMRMSALVALKRVGAPDALPALLKRMEDGPLPEKIAAGKAIYAAGPSGREALKKLQSSDDSLISRVAHQVYEEEGA